MNANGKRIAGFALKSRLPSMYGNRETVDAGGLMYYGADQADSYRRVAYYVDRILKGAKPADLPVEQPTKFELVINLKTAKQIGLTIPQSMSVSGGQSDPMTEIRGQKSEISKATVLVSMVFALCSLLLAPCFCGRGAADRESPPHRFPRSKHCFRQRGPRGGVSARAEQAWMD